MNDFEDRLRRTPLRPPPSGWHDEVLAAAAPRSWCEEIWPSLSAWAALAAVWIILFAAECLTGSPGEATKTPNVTKEPPSSDSVLAFHAALNSANTSTRIH